MTPIRFARFCVAVLLAATLCSAQAQAPIKLASLLELTGAGTTAGTNFRNGLALAIDEINQAGGILGSLVENTVSDTQSNPALATTLAQKAVKDKVFAVFGPVFSGSILASMGETQRAAIPNFTGGEAAAITLQGNPYIFRTSFTQATAMPKVALYLEDKTQIRRLAVIYVNNDFGKGGLAMLKKALEPTRVKLATEVSTEQAQTDFSTAVQKARQGDPDGIFVYSNEDESARILRELRKQGWTKPVIGETTLTGQKVIEAAGDAANGVIAHVGLSIDAPVPAIRAFRAKFERAYKYTPDHNGMKGYSGMYLLKAAIERAGKLDNKAVAKVLKGLKVSADRYPGALLYTEFDQKGDLDRMSFLVEVRNGRQEVVDFSPPLFTNKRRSPP